LLCLGLLVLGAASSAAAQEDRVRAYIRPRAVDDATQIRLVIEIRDFGNSQVEPPNVPRKMTNLRLIGGPSTEFQWSSGRGPSTYKLVYTLLADGPGAAEIPVIVVKVDGRPYRTKAIRFEVAEAKNLRRPQSSAPQGREEPSAEDANVFLTAELGAATAWVGQPVTLTVKLFTAENVWNTSWLQRPSFGNFWVEQLEIGPDERYQTRHGGRAYTVYPAERKVLIPPSPGEFEIEPYVARMEVRKRGRDVFEIFGGTREIVRKTRPLRLQVRELPDAAPEDFSGAVGEFAIRAALDRNAAAVDDAVALRVTIDGEGSLRSVNPPNVAAPADLQLFEPRVADSFDLSGGELRSKKSWEWVVVPLAPGELRLPEIRFTFFNPATERYETAQTEPILLAVGKSERREDRPSVRAGVQEQRRDLAFVKLLRGSLAEEYPRAHQRGVFVMLLVLPLVWVPLVVVIGRRQARLQQDQGLARSRRARARARKRLRVARRNLEQTDSAAFHEEVARALVEYVADRFNRSATGLTYDVADELLASRSIESGLRREFRGCLETCDFARFVPSAGKTERREETLSQAEELVERLERAW
jgi:hypothetical protein